MLSITEPVPTSVHALSLCTDLISLKRTEPNAITKRRKEGIGTQAKKCKEGIGTQAKSLLIQT